MTSSPKYRPVPLRERTASTPPALPSCPSKRRRKPNSEQGQVHPTASSESPYRQKNQHKLSMTSSPKYRPVPLRERTASTPPALPSFPSKRRKNQIQNTARFTPQPTAPPLPGMDAPPREKTPIRPRPGSPHNRSRHHSLSRPPRREKPQFGTRPGSPHSK